MNTSTLDELIDCTDAMLRNRHAIKRRREELLEHEARADSARLEIDRLQRAQLELAARQAGLRP